MQTDIRTELISSVSKRRESYIIKKYPELYKDLMEQEEYVDFITFSDKLTKFLYGGGYCMVCNIRTKKNTGAPGFRECCSSKCAGINKRGIEAHNKINIDYDVVRQMYLDKKTPVEIGEYFNCSNATINKIIKELGIKRTHSEQQKIHSGARGKRPWNYSGIKEYNFIGERPKSAYVISKQFDTHINNVYLYSLKQGYKFTSKSYIEDIIKEILDDLKVDYVVNRRNIIPPLELDFYIPSFNIAIECNGLYHHCHINKDRMYHYNKYISCKEKGILLLQFWEDDIRDNRDKIKSYLKSKFGMNKTIYARKCVIETVSSKTAFEFYSKYHLQGSTKNGTHKGLYFNGILVACMSFSKKSNDTVELTRYCTIEGSTVVGGFSKLLKLYNDYNIISFSNNDYSDGSVYKNNGFDQISINKNNLMYTDLKKRYNREMFMKHRLADLYPLTYDVNKTEKEILELNKIYQCVGSGTVKWYKSKSTDVKKALD